MARQGKAVRLRWLPTFAGDPGRVEQAALLLSRILAAGGIALIAVTRPLWTPQSVFPRIPFFGWLRGVPAWLYQRSYWARSRPFASAIA